MLHPALKCCTWTSPFLSFIGKHHCSFSQISGRRPNLEITAAKCQILFTQDKKSHFSPQWLDAAHCSCDQHSGATLLRDPRARGLRARIPREIHLIAFSAHAFVSFYPPPPLFFFFVQELLAKYHRFREVPSSSQYSASMFELHVTVCRRKQPNLSTSHYLLLFQYPQNLVQILFISTSKGKFFT